ncbi:hypothetical protein JB92DRAFT_2740058 [Gautieria morchelliformis]|nr:hypothetical protein JB92DRAFT_2740058 [Gautieria morchelliformis]
MKCPPDRYDIVAIQEPYIDFLGNTRASSHWYSVHPKSHYQDRGKGTRSTILVNKKIATSAWSEVEVGSPGITCGCCWLPGRFLYPCKHQPIYPGLGESKCVHKNTRPEGGIVRTMILSGIATRLPQFRWKSIGNSDALGSSSSPSRAQPSPV